MRAGISRVGGCLFAIIAIGVFVFVCYGGERAFDVVEAPWAYQLPGRPAMAGHWVSTFATSSGIHFALYMELERGLEGGEPYTNEEGVAMIGGRASWCDDQGRHVENHEVSGGVMPFVGYTGSIDPVAIQIAAGDPPPVGLLPTSFKGKWDGDTLTLKSDFSYWTGSAFQASDNIDQTQPTTITLRRGEVDTYKAACAKLG